MQPLKVIASLGTIFNFQKPYPVSVYWETMTYPADLVWNALALFIPENLSAGHFLSVCAEIIAGGDPRNKEYFILVEPNPCGWGAEIDKLK
jgi:N-methylhydantoinase B